MASLSTKIVFVFLVIYLSILLLSGSFTLFKVLRRSPSVKIPANFFLSITKATPRPFELISINVSDKVISLETIGKSFPFDIKSSTVVMSLLPSFPPG